MQPFYTITVLPVRPVRLVIRKQNWYKRSPGQVECQFSVKKVKGQGYWSQKPQEISTSSIQVYLRAADQSL